MTGKDHNKLVGIFLLVHGGFQAVLMTIMGIIYAIAGTAIFFGGRGDDKFVGVFMIVAVIFVAIFSILFLAPQIIGGWKMLKEKPNAKTWGIIGSILACFSFPMGTALGVYGIWFLFGEEGKKFYSNQSNQNYLGETNQVSDFNYQNYQQQQQREPHSWR